MVVLPVLLTPPVAPVMPVQPEQLPTKALAVIVPGVVMFPLKLEFPLIEGDISAEDTNVLLLNS